MPKSFDLPEDLAAIMPQFKLRTIFDVGANVGQSIRAFRRAWRKANIWSFEPIPSTFSVLETSFGAKPNVKLFNLALSDSSGVARMRALDGSTKNRILSEDEMSPSAADVESITGDEFCSRHDVQRIGFLKIDTEGHDLKVLMGFEGMLDAQKIDLIQVEAGMHPQNKVHVPLDDLKHYLEQRGYALFKFYDQTFEYSGPVKLRRANPVFISDRVARKNRRTRTPKPAPAAASPAQPDS